MSDLPESDLPESDILSPLGRLAPEGPFRRGPAMILVRSQLGENIGSAARAMLNCAVTEMRLVAPRDGWPQPSAYVTASRADPVLDGVSLFKTANEATADLHRVYATTARNRDLVKEVLTPRRAAERMRAEAAAGLRVGVLFGPERTGLENDELALANALICVPLNPGFSSLNLAQAVLLVCYEWFTAADTTPPERNDMARTPRATKGDIDGFFDHLVAELDASGFFANIPDKREGMLVNIRGIFERGNHMQQDFMTLHGIVKALALGRPKRRRVGRRGQPIPPEGGLWPDQDKNSADKS